MKPAFIIGNGETRRGFDLTRLKPYGTIFGCNALYRDYYPGFEVPDYLVAIDDGIIGEIEQQQDFPSQRVIFPPADERWEPAECNRDRPRSNAGMNAMREAIKMGYDQLICLGFDFLVQGEEYNTSNIYDGTRNYGPNTRANSADNPGRYNYLNWLVCNNPEVDFIFIFPEVLTKGKIYGNISGSNVYVNSYENLDSHI
jgi:hypothetical protein